MKYFGGLCYILDVVRHMLMLFGLVTSKDTFLNFNATEVEE